MFKTSLQGTEVGVHINRNFFFILLRVLANFKIRVNFMKPTFLCTLRQDKAYNKK